MNTKTKATILQYFFGVIGGGMLFYIFAVYISDCQGKIMGDGLPTTPWYLYAIFIFFGLATIATTAFIDVIKEDEKEVKPTK